MASGLYDKMCKLETGFFACFWHAVLERFNCTSKELQDDQIDLNTAVILLKSLNSFVQSLRDRFDDFERDGAQRSGATQYSQQNQRVRRANVRLNTLDYGQTPEVQRSPKDRFRGDSFLPVIDLLISALSSRLKAYISSRFGFLRLLDQLSADEVGLAATKLVDTYPTDFEDGLGDEIIQFQHCVELLRNEKEDRCSIENFMYKIIINKNLKSTFPNVEIMLRIY